MNTNRNLIAVLAVVLLVAGVAAVLLWTAQPPQLPPAPAAAPTSGGAVLDRLAPVDPAGNFALVAPLQADGTEADMKVYRGKTLLVNFWATWCAPCIEELPALGKLQESLGGDQFAVVTIALDEPDAAKVAPFLAQHGAGNLPALIDGKRTVDKVMRVSALPTSILVDRDGMIRASLTGDADWTCGKALAAVKAFIADATVETDKLERCE
jgi:thiol-disulfide isomerase/thioredoxin